MDALEERLLRELTWSALHEALHPILLGDDAAGSSYHAVALVWSATLADLVPTSARAEITAELYHWLDRRQSDPGGATDAAENLVWSIATNLWHREYLDDWDPRQEPEVARVLQQLASFPKGSYR